MGPREVSESQSTREMDNVTQDELSQHSQSLGLHAKSLCSVQSDTPISENLKSGKATMQTSLPSLPSRGQPFPFILPQPLGPLSSPTRSLTQADSITRTLKTENPAMLGTYGLPDMSTWGSRGVNAAQSGGFLMPQSTPVAAAGLASLIRVESTTGPRPYSSQQDFSRQMSNQSFSQPAVNRWDTPATGPPRQEETVLERPSFGGTYNDNPELVHYHKCDECHEAFTTSSWLKWHKTTHFRRFRCGCGAAYIDNVLLLVSL